MKDIFVINRNGEKELLDYEKIHRVLSFACDDITGVSISEIEFKARIQFYDDITTQEIHELIVKAAGDLVTENVNYAKVASRLQIFNLRKKVYSQYEPTRLYDLVVANTEAGVYTPELLEQYTEEEFDKMDSWIRHTRDDNFLVAGIEQLKGKYLTKNRVTGKFFESPQVAYMLVAATGFINDTKNRLTHVRKFYNYVSTFKYGIATPLLAGLRTPTKQFSSCVLIDSDDSLDSIGKTTIANMQYVSKKAGLGNNIGRIREEGAEIRNGEVKHTGLLPFIKLFKSATKSCSQGGIRGGAMTAYYPIWHYDVEDLLVLKNNKGTDENRERHIDYGVQFNQYLISRMIKDDEICLFSPHQTDLYEAFFADQDEFKRLYEKYERATGIKKKKISGLKLLKKFLTERFNTGRIYMMMADTANIYSPFDESIDPIYQSNLCAEILLPCKPMGKTEIERDVKIRPDYSTKFLLDCFNDERILDCKVSEGANPDDGHNYFDVTTNAGRIQLCTLSNINWGAFSSPTEFEDACYYIVRFLDNVLTYQDYPMIEAQMATEEYRPLGIGVNNLAYFIAKNDCKYGDEKCLALVDEWMQHMAYYLQKATIDLAEERGACKKSDTLLRSKGVMVIDQYKKTVDELVPHKEYLDWDLLRERAKEHGVRNATTTATPPSESNSQVINSTNGAEPVRSPIVFKDSKDGSLPNIIPGYHTLKNKYDYLWEMKDMQGYIKTVAVLQKCHDQTISSNTSYNVELYPDNKIPMSVLINDFLTCVKYGVATLYYNNTKPIKKKLTDEEGNTTVVEEKPQLPDPFDEDDCENCVL